MSYLVDTNVLSEQRKPAPDAGVTEWFAQVDQRVVYLSVVTVGEVRRGIGRLTLRRDHLQAARLAQWLTTTVRDFDERILPVTLDVAQRWGDHDARRPMPAPDGLIGATAAARGWTLVTRNVKDFAHLDVELLNPFTEETTGR